MNIWISQSRSSITIWGCKNEMEVRFYSPEMNFIGLMENQKSLVWKRKFYEPGSIKLFCPLTDDNLKLTRKGNLVWKRGAKEAAVIEDRLITDTVDDRHIEVEGRFLSSYMDRRLIMPRVQFSGRVEVAMRQLLSGIEFPIPLVELGDLNGFTETISFQATYKNLLEYETKLSKCSDIGFRFRPDFNEKKIFFETYKGTDRTISQVISNRVIFSDMYNNLNEMTYRENDLLLKNVVFIGGQGQGDERVIVSFGSAEGLERRELFVDARDLERTEGMTLQEYEEKLIQRGLEKQTSCQESTTIECVTDANANFEYITNYDLGDIVTVKKKDWGITLNLRITEIEEVYEKGKMEIYPVFGDPLPESIDWRDD